METETIVPMKPTEIISIILAIYAAIMSTINTIISLRSKKWKMVVTYSLGVNQGKHTITYQAVNLGERSIAVSRFWIEVIFPKPNLWHRIRRFFLLLKIMITGYGAMLTGNSLSSVEESVIQCNPLFPFDLNPGKSCELALDEIILIRHIVSDPQSNKFNIRGVFEDQTGKYYKSRIAKVDYLNKDIDFG